MSTIQARISLSFFSLVVVSVVAHNQFFFRIRPLRFFAFFFSFSFFILFFFSWCYRHIFSLLWPSEQVACKKYVLAKKETCRVDTHAIRYFETKE
jgi:hypothetical protein